MWNEIRGRHDKQKQKDVQNKEQERIEAARLRAEEKKRIQKGEDKKRILRERPGDIKRAVCMQLGISADSYDEIVNGTFGNDIYSISSLAQKILGETTTEKSALRSAYRREAKKYHPDRNNGGSAEEELITEEKMKILQRFYETLRNRKIVD